MGDGCNMGAEMRKARRTDIDVTVSLNQLGQIVFKIKLMFTL